MKDFVQNVTSNEILAEMKFTERDFDLDDYTATVDELCKKFGTDQNLGLSHAAAEKHRAFYGDNVLQPMSKYDFEIVRFLRCMFYEVALVFWITAIIFMINIWIQYDFSKELRVVDLSLCCAMVFNGLSVGVCTYAQGRTKKFSYFPRMPTRRFEVIREGESMKVLAKDLVMGDLVLLKGGDAVPADIRMIKNHNIKVDQFRRTGVQDPYLIQEIWEGNPVEGSSVAYYTGVVTEGYGQGIVIRTGKYTLAARAIFPRHLTPELICPITREIMWCLNSSAGISFLVGIFILFVFMVVETSHRSMNPLLVLIIIVLNAIPTNLLHTLIISLKIYSRKMMLHYCICDNMIALERLPFLSTICLSKPGVLTQNKVNVSNLWFDKKIVEVWSGSRIVWKEKSSQTFRELALCAVLCNEADFQEDQEDKPILKRSMRGNEYDVAILKLMLNIIGKKVERLRENYPRVYWIPFAQQHNYQCSVHKAGEQYLMIVIGEPEILVRKCTTYAMDGINVEVNGDFRRAIDKACVQFAKFSETLKCVVDQTISDPEELKRFRIPKSGFRFVGIISLSDSPRSGLPQALARYRQAGIKVVLMTSDHPIVARSFARQIGVFRDESKTIEEIAENKSRSEEEATPEAVIVDVTQLKKLSMKKVGALVAKYPEIAFTRTNATQRFLLVSALQMRHHSVVGVIGDIEGDCLAMKKSDISMTYRDESSSSKSNADIYISDETFTSLSISVEEARIVYENMRKSCMFLFASNAPAVSAMVAFCIFGFPLPLSPMAFIIVQTVTDLFPSVALTFEKSDEDIMTRRPEHFFSGKFWSWPIIFNSCLIVGMIETAACFLTYFIIMFMYGWTPVLLFEIRDVWNCQFVNDLEDSNGEQWSYAARENLERLAQTGFFMALVIMQAANVLACRSQTKSIILIRERNWFIHFAILLQMSVTICYIYLPFFGLLHPLDPIMWLIPMPFFIILVAYDEIKKLLIRRKPQGFAARELTY